MDFRSTIEFAIYADIWNFHKRYYEVSDCDEYWEAAVKDANGLYKKYDNSKFAKSLVMAVMDELERKAKEARINAKTQSGI